MTGAVRELYIGESDGTKYDVTGDGHERTAHPTLREELDAADASLD